MRIILIITVMNIAFGLASCSGRGGNNDSSPSYDPNRLKIFVTTERHLGDFANDPTLSGSNSIAKADNFCNKASNKPNDNASYKALLVAANYREASTRLDWVLLPSRTYYRADGVTEIGITDGNGLLMCHWIPLTNSIGNTPGMFVNPVWVGLSGTTWQIASAGTCLGWSSTTGNGTVGFSGATDANAVDTSNYYDCRNNLPLYCVQQLP
jgi:hypothetical protein